MKNFLQKTIILLIIFIFIFPAIFNFNKKIAFAVGESWSYDFTMAGEVKHVKNPYGFDSLVKCETARKDFMDNTVSKNPGLYISITQCESVTVYYYEYFLKTSGGTLSKPSTYDFTTPEDCEIARQKTTTNNLNNPDSVTSPACLKRGEAIVYITPGTNTGATSSSVYNLLAPIGAFKVAPDNIGDYFNTIFLIAIGLCGALAVIMIVIGGIQYMGDESIFGKTEAKSRIKSAILGLLIALGSYALLRTINPALLGGNINIKQVSAEIVDLPDAGDSTVDSKCKAGSATYSTTTPVSSGVTSAITKLKAGYSIKELNITSSTNKMTISLINGSTVDISNSIDIKPGTSNYSEVGQGQTKDRKTPKGTWKILSIRNPGEKKAVCNGTGSNMGAGFWLLSPTTNGERGIGIHGNETGTITNTAGCIRITNSDLLALLPYIKTGIPVNIN